MFSGLWMRASEMLRSAISACSRLSRSSNSTRGNRCEPILDRLSCSLSVRVGSSVLQVAQVVPDSRELVMTDLGHDHLLTGASDCERSTGRREDGAAAEKTLSCGASYQVRHGEVGGVLQRPHREVKIVAALLLAQAERRWAEDEFGTGQRERPAMLGKAGVVADR